LDLLGKWGKLWSLVFVVAEPLFFFFFCFIVTTDWNSLHRSCSADNRRQEPRNSALPCSHSWPQNWTADAWSCCRRSRS
jgi:hypothetical protein